MILWKYCHYFQSKLLSVNISFYPTLSDTQDPWQMICGTAALASPHVCQTLSANWPLSMLPQFCDFQQNILCWKRPTKIIESNS